MPSTTSNLQPPQEALPQPLEREYRLLKVAVTGADDGFRLVVAACNDPKRQKDLIQRLADDLAGQDCRVTELDVSENAGSQGLLAALEKHLQQATPAEGWQRAVMVTGCEARVEFPAAKPSDRAFFETANAQRDAFARVCTVPVVLWLTPLTTAALGHYAPDLWHWRVASLDFTVPWETRVSACSDQLALPVIETASLPVEKKADRIALLRRLLAELESARDEERSLLRVASRRAGLLTALGRTLFDTSVWRESSQCYEKALRIYENLGDQMGEGATWHQLASIDLKQGNYAAAREKFRKSLVIRQTIGNRAGEVSTWHQLATIDVNEGNYAAAREKFEKSLVMRQATGDRTGEATTRNNLATIDVHEGNYAAARENLGKSLEIEQAIGDRATEAATWHNLATIELKEGAYAAARENFRKSLAIKQAIGDQAGEAATWHNLASIDLNEGSYAAAREKFEKSLAIKQAIGDQVGEAATWHQLASIDLDEGSYPSAREKFARALAMQQTIGDRAAEAATFYQIGVTAWATGQRELGIRLVGVSYYLDSAIGSGGAEATLQGLNHMAKQMDLDEAGLKETTTKAAAQYERDRGASLVQEALAEP
jgi:tetratricopeptide (TPR) repeat protein